MPLSREMQPLVGDRKEAPALPLPSVADAKPLSFISLKVKDLLPDTIKALLKPGAESKRSLIEKVLSDSIAQAKVSKFLSISDRFKLGRSSRALLSRVMVFPYILFKESSEEKTFLKDPWTIEELQKIEKLNKSFLEKTGASLFLILNPNYNYNRGLAHYICRDVSTQPALCSVGASDDSAAWKIKISLGCANGFNKLCPFICIFSWPSLSVQNSISAAVCVKGEVASFAATTAISWGGALCLSSLICCLYLKANGTFEVVDSYVRDRDERPRALEAANRFSLFYQQTVKPVLPNTMSRLDDSELRAAQQHTPSS